MTARQKAMSGHLKMLIAVGAVALCAFKCSRPQEAFLTVQVCLVDERGANQFLKVMREVASSEGLKFVDDSSDTEGWLRSVRDNGLVKINHVPTINAGIEGDGGLGVTAGNLGLPSNQVALGFTAGSDAAKARRLSDRLVTALSKRWRVQRVPQRKGVFPMSGCSSLTRMGRHSAPILSRA